MTLEIYKVTIFLICISIGIQFIEFNNIACSISPVTGNKICGTGEYYKVNPITQSLQSFVDYMFGTQVPSGNPLGNNSSTTQKVLDLMYLGISFATFGFLLLTMRFMLAFFWYGYVIGSFYTTQFFGANSIIGIGLLLLLTIIYITGYMQYQANLSLRQM